MTDAVKFQILNRFTGTMQFECELGTEIACMSFGFRLGFAVKKAIELRADLSGADLSRAYLSGANLSGAYLSCAKWRAGIIIQRAPLQISGLAYPVTILDQHMQIGCELHSIAEWAAFDNERIARMDGIRARKFWDAHGASLLALAASDGRGVEVATPEVDQ